MSRPVSFFLSYSRHDDAYARTIAGRKPEFVRILEGLRDAAATRDEFRIVSDELLECGEVWEPKLEAALQECDALIALLSDDFLQSAHCIEEVAFVRKQRKRVFPFMLSACDPGTVPVLRDINTFPNPNRPLLSFSTEHERTVVMLEFRELHLRPFVRDLRNGRS